jgi:hypothetical protein
VRVLSKNEVDGFIQEGRKLSEREGTLISDDFKRVQPLMYQAIFGELSDGIAEENVDMANLFLDLCFDVILVYQMAFGSAPAEPPKKEWFDKKISLLDAKLKSLNDEDRMNSKFRQRLSNRFVERSIATGIQLEYSV